MRSTTTRWRVFFRAAIAVAMLLGTLFIAAPQAQATSEGPICEVGVLTPDGCEVEGLGGGTECPALEDGDECYNLVPAEAGCPDGALLVIETVEFEGGSFEQVTCRVPVDDAAPVLSCEPPGQLTEAGCSVVTEPEFELQCEVGDLLGDRCVESLGEAEQLLNCADVQDIEGQCFIASPATYDCGDGVPIPESFDCAGEVPAEEGPPVCPQPGSTATLEFADGPHCGITIDGDFFCEVGNYIGNGLCRDSFFPLDPCGVFQELYPVVFEYQGTCYGIDDGTGFPPCQPPAVEIFEGEECGVPLGEGQICPFPYDFDFEECFLISNADPICPSDYPTTFLLVQEEGVLECFQDFGLLTPVFFCGDGISETGTCPVVYPATLVCEEGAILDADLERCLTPTDPEPGNFLCQGEILVLPTSVPGDDFFVIDGICYRDLGRAQQTPVCIEGSVFVEDVGCELITPPIETASCGDNLGEPGGCYTLADVIGVCPDGTTPDPLFQEECREPVDRTGGCEVGTPNPDGVCVTYEDPLYFCNGLPVTINMQLGDPGLGTGGADVILGTADADAINGRGGNDTICGGDGDDRIIGSSGTDTIFGEAGIDTIFGGSGGDVIDAGTGADAVFAGSGDDVVVGGPGADRLVGSGGNDDLRGGEGDDNMNGGSGNDLLIGNEGNDTMVGSTGDDDLRGNTGNDNVYGGSGNDVVSGGAGNDVVRGNSGQDRLFGNAGDDTLSGSSGEDILRGGIGNDRLFGGLDSDLLDGGPGTDFCSGSSGLDAGDRCEFTSSVEETVPQIVIVGPPD